jgi:hypothetical protein
MIGLFHSHIFSSIELLLNEQGIVDVVKTALRGGVQKLTSSKSHIVQCSLHIKSLIQQYQTVPMVQFLDSIQHNLTTQIL